MKVVRSSSVFGFGLVNMIFKEGTDFYWARTRVLERLDFAKKDIPDGATVTLEPDATAIGQIFWYTVEGNGYSLEELRSIQDWYIRYQLRGVEGVSEVASVGGYIKQYQVEVDPNKLMSYDISILYVMNAIKMSNIDVGAKGEPIEVTYKGKIYNLCCPGCEEAFLENPEKYIEKIEQ